MRFMQPCLRLAQLMFASSRETSLHPLSISSEASRAALGSSVLAVALRGSSASSQIPRTCHGYLLSFS